LLEQIHGLVLCLTCFASRRWRIVLCRISFRPDVLPSLSQVIRSAIPPLIDRRVSSSSRSRPDNDSDPIVAKRAPGFREYGVIFRFEKNTGCRIAGKNRFAATDGASSTSLQSFKRVTRFRSELPNVRLRNHSVSRTGPDGRRIHKSLK
jgi:hypothetical protein